MGTADDGLFLISGRPSEGINVEEADQELCEFLYNYLFPNDFEHDLQKVQHRAESILLNSEIKIDERATNIAIGETLSNAEYFLNERQHYLDITSTQMQRIARGMFCEEQSSTLFYKSKR